MSDKWVMEEWMREVLNTAGPNWANWFEYEMRRDSSGVTDFINILERLRTAGLLQTPGEKTKRARYVLEIERDIARLRTENETMRELVKEAADTMQDDAGMDHVANLFRTALGSDDE